jgi:hypothetical protein
VRILPSTSVPFRPTTVRMPNSALIETKRITVLAGMGGMGGMEPIPNVFRITYYVFFFMLTPSDVYFCLPMCRYCTLSKTIVNSLVSLAYVAASAVSVIIM